jgi:hypothetical protein
VGGQNDLTADEANGTPLRGKDEGGIMKDEVKQKVATCRGLSLSR